MPKTVWRIAVTIESSAKDRIRELADDECRSPSNYVRRLLEQAQRQEVR